MDLSCISELVWIYAVFSSSHEHTWEVFTVLGKVKNAKEKKNLERRTSRKVSIKKGLVVGGSKHGLQKNDLISYCE